MNATVTNFTDISGEIVPLIETVDEDVDDEFNGLGFIESSFMKVIPKFLKAIATLLICGLLLGATFLLIFLWKRGCHTHKKLKDDAKNGKGGAALHSVVVTPSNDDEDSIIDEQSLPGEIPSSSLQPIRSNYMKVPMQPKKLLRRASGPFGSEALSFVGEQYTMKVIEREGHHHHSHGHGHGHHNQHFHSGASSAGGGSAQNDEANETKSKWNCFKGSKE